MTKKVICVYTEAGGGHKATAEALILALSSKQPEWNYETCSVFREVLASLDWSKKYLNISGEAIYNQYILQRRYTWLIPCLFLILKFRIRAKFQLGLKSLVAYWQRTKPDIVISCMGLVNKVLYQSVRHYSLNVPFVVLLTDFEESYADYWIQEKYAYYICGTENAYQQALAYGIHSTRIFKTSGMLVKKDFYTINVTNRAKQLAELGLMPEKLTGLVMFGGYGSDYMRTVIAQCADSKTKLQLILICGYDEALRRELLNMLTPYPKVVLGYVSNISYYMQLADFFIGKPGPGSISEALISGLPVITEKNSKTLKQEKVVADWIKKEKMGYVLTHFNHLSEQLPVLALELNKLKKQVKTFCNRAFYEVPHVLITLLEQKSEE